MLDCWLELTCKGCYGGAFREVTGRLTCSGRKDRPKGGCFVLHRLLLRVLDPHLQKGAPSQSAAFRAWSYVARNLGGCWASDRAVQISELQAAPAMNYGLPEIEGTGFCKLGQRSLTLHQLEIVTNNQRQHRSPHKSRPCVLELAWTTQGPYKICLRPLTVGILGPRQPQSAVP